ncbi:MAG: flagellar biosynthetic protein FliO [Phycisphaeraceae bacterium]
MRAWFHTIALVGALLVGSGATSADEPLRALANAGGEHSIDAPRSPDAPASPSGSAEGARPRRDLSDLARQLADDRTPAQAAADAADRTASNDRTTTAAASDDDAPLSRGSQSAGLRRDASPSTSASDADRLPLLNENERASIGQRSDDDDAPTHGLIEGTGSMALNTLTALGIVIGLILLLRWAWVKLSGQPTIQSSPVVEVLSRTPVAPRNHILLVRVANRVLIVGDSSAGLRTLATVDDPEEIADLLTAVTAGRDTSITKGFNQLLGRFQGEHDTAHVDDEGRDDGEHLFDRARDSVSGLLSRVRVMAGRDGDGVDRSTERGGRG